MCVRADLEDERARGDGYPPLGSRTIGSLAAAAGAWFQERRTTTIQLAAIHRKLDLVMTHLGIAAPEEPEVVRHLQNGRTIEAVRAYREQTGAGLVEAKQPVDRIAARLDRT